MLVKICGITSEADALLAVALGADAVGFVLPRLHDKSRLEQMEKSTINRLPRAKSSQLGCSETSRRSVSFVSNGIGLRAAQLHGSASQRLTPMYVVERVSHTIKAFPAGHPDIGG